MSERADVRIVPFRSTGGVRSQISDTAQRRITEIRARRAELLSEWRKLVAEEVDLLGIQSVIGVEFEDPKANAPA